MHLSLKLIIQIVIGVAGYSVWAVMAYADPTLRPDFLKFNVAMAVGTIGLVLRDMQAPPPPPPAVVTPSAPQLATQ